MCSACSSTVLMCCPSPRSMFCLFINGSDWFHYKREYDALLCVPLARRVATLLLTIITTISLLMTMIK
jgi:hypothetical protein